MDFFLSFIGILVSSLLNVKQHEFPFTTQVLGFYMHIKILVPRMPWTEAIEKSNRICLCIYLLDQSAITLNDESEFKTK